jgi:hypothetical protein
MIHRRFADSTVAVPGAGRSRCLAPDSRVPLPEVASSRDMVKHDTQFARPILENLIHPSSSD